MTVTFDQCFARTLSFFSASSFLHLGLTFCSCFFAKQKKAGNRVT